MRVSTSSTSQSGLGVSSQPLLAGALAAAASSVTAQVPAPAALALTAKSKFLLAAAAPASSSATTPAKSDGALVSQKSSGSKSKTPFDDAPPEARIYRSTSVFDEKRQQQTKSTRPHQQQQQQTAVATAKEKETEKLKTRPVFVSPLQSVSVPCASRQVHPDEMLNLEALNWGGGRMPRSHRTSVPFYVHMPTWQRHLAKELPRRNWERVRAERSVAAELHGIANIPPLAVTFHEDRMLVCEPLPHNRFLKLVTDVAQKEKQKEEQSAKAT